MGDRDNDEIECERRGPPWKRFLFINGVSLTTLLIVTFSAGLIVQRVNSIEVALATTLPPLIIKVHALEVRQAVQDSEIRRMQ